MPVLSSIPHGYCSGSVQTPSLRAFDRYVAFQQQTSGKGKGRCGTAPRTKARKAEALLDRRDLFFLSTAAAVAAGLLAPLQAAAAPSTVFVAGASGKTGRKVVEYLASQGIAVRAGVRDIDKARASGLDKPGGVTLVNGDVTAGPESLAEAIGNAEAVICATGYSGGKRDVPCAAASCSTGADGYDLVERQGTINLVDAAKLRGVSKFVLMSSLLTNARAIGQGLNPIFLLINGFGGVLDKKHKAEEYLRASGLNWTIIRPGGLSTDPPSKVGGLIIRGEDTLRGLPSDPGRAISRQTVAETGRHHVVLNSARSDSSWHIHCCTIAGQCRQCADVV
ncbi:hypothetical protein WJX73_002081 [Symbiochloris irregularis]|uniref:NAD(P)-binding domain-containing protein n=1 Tax=Symbiochloris irregularis TaxID=706552 RepID=A0AAW1NZ02_9CHLO